ncbi:glycosyltransferase [Rivularia sp. UHCC 0363]|uniref:glycosyltransferase n=1 Tax=Rivularia sp. UHCC 0363 TaxID=3110244 RepID=UPI002B202210|nr:glycosyltransferase [Rivularia sp. UHCC 0363]MEA5599130.1 glycosyltransferase [Rivularia sp. UHCC 0363]
MSRIVLTTIGSLGDFHPLVAIALELRERGHDIVFVTTKQHKNAVELLGFEFHALRPDYASPDDPAMMALMMDLKRGTERVVRDYIFGNLEETYADLLAAAQGADFILAGDIVYAAQPVAEMLNIPWALCTLAPTSFLSAYDPPVLPPLPLLIKLRAFGPSLNQPLIHAIKLTLRPWGEPMQQLRQKLGLAPIDNPVADGKFSPYLNLALFSSKFAAPQTDWPAKTVITGFCFYDGSTHIQPALQEFLDAGPAPILFTLGSAAVCTPGRFYLESIEAAVELNRRAVLLIGKNVPPAELPAGIVTFDYAPYSAIFPRACVIVHQGGIGTTAQALRSGHPTLVVPYSHDQPDNAARLERLGTSRTVSRNRYSASRAVKGLRELLRSPKYAAKASDVSHALQAESGVYTACEQIEQQLDNVAV